MPAYGFVQLVTIAPPGTPIDAPSEGPDVTPGSQTLTANGNFTVPVYNVLTIKLFGGGAEGGDPSANGINGQGTTITSLSLSAGGGVGGKKGSDGGDGGAGGTASGGDSNINGDAGVSDGGKGGNCPNGGPGGAADGGDGNIPGGGGGGDRGVSLHGGGGGGGAYVEKSYNTGEIAPETVLAVVVGGTANSSSEGGRGARGEARFSWI